MADSMDHHTGFGINCHRSGVVVALVQTGLVHNRRLATGFVVMLAALLNGGLVGLRLHILLQIGLATLVSLVAA